MACERNSTDLISTRLLRNGTARLFLCLVCVLVFGGVGCQDDSAALLRDAEAFHSAGRFELAIEALREILDRDRDDLGANLLLGKIFVHMGEPGLAIWRLERVLTSASHATTAGPMLVASLVTLKDDQAGLDVLDTLDALSIDQPVPGELLLLRARALLGLGRDVEALEAAERAQASMLEAESVEAAVLRGVALVRLGRMGDAKAMWERLAEPTSTMRVPDHSTWACVQLARLLESEKEDEAAAATHAVCLDRFGSDVTLGREASNFHLRAGEVERSISILRGIARANPSDLTLSLHLATLLRGVGQMEEAVSELEGTARFVDSANAWHQFGDFQRSVGANQAALDAWHQGLNRDPEDRDALIFALADLNTVENRLESAVQLRDQLMDASLRRIISGAIAFRRGDLREALRELETGLVDWPNNAGARDLAGQAAAALDETDRAVSHFREAIRSAPGATDAARRLARIHASRGEDLQALELASRHAMTRRYDGDPAAFQIGIRSAIALERWDDAQVFIDMLDRAEPDSEWSDAAEAEIRRLRANVVQEP